MRGPHGHHVPRIDLAVERCGPATGRRHPPLRQGGRQRPSDTGSRPSPTPLAARSSANSRALACKPVRGDRQKRRARRPGERRPRCQRRHHGRQWAGPSPCRCRPTRFPCRFTGNMDGVIRAPERLSGLPGDRPARDTQRGAPLRRPARHGRRHARVLRAESAASQEIVGSDRAACARGHWPGHPRDERARRSARRLRGRAALASTCGEDLAAPNSVHPQVAGQGRWPPWRCSSARARARRADQASCRHPDRQSGRPRRTGSGLYNAAHVSCSCRGLRWRGPSCAVSTTARTRWP